MPSALRTVPGSTAYGEPTCFSSAPTPRSDLATAASRFWPYGAKSFAMKTCVAPTSLATCATTSTGLPMRTTSAPDISRFNSRSDRNKNAKRGAPERSKNIGSKTNSGVTAPDSDALLAATRAGLSSSRKSRRNQITELFIYLPLLSTFYRQAIRTIAALIKVITPP